MLAVQLLQYIHLSGIILTILSSLVALALHNKYIYISVLSLGDMIDCYTYIKKQQINISMMYDKESYCKRKCRLNGMLFVIKF